jgi:hypothetical protein
VHVDGTKYVRLVGQSRHPCSALMTLSGPGRSLEHPSEAALHGVVLHAVAELARVGHACGGVGRERKVEAGIDERGVLGERHAIDGETDARWRQR